MKPEQNNVEDLFRSAFEDASLELPRKEEMWAAIRGAVQSEPVPVIPIFRTRWFRASIAASIVLLVGVFYYFSQSNSSKETNTLVVAGAKVNSDMQSNEIQQDNENKIAGNTEKYSKKLDTPADTKKSSSIGTNDNSEFNNNIAQKSTDKSSSTLAQGNIATSNHTNISQSGVVAKSEAIVGEQPEKLAKGDVFAGVKYEIMEIVALASPEIVIPFAIEKQPILQLVAIVQPSVEIEKTSPTNTFWVGFSGFYNSHKPNFQFNTPDLPSPFIKGKLSSINFSDSSNVAKDIRENMTINSSIALNIDFGKVIGKYWFVKSGLSFNSTRYSINSPVVELLAEPNPTNPTVLGKTKVVANTISNATTVINIPVQFGYQSDKQGFNYFVGGGVSADILLNNSLTSTYSPAVYDFGNYKSLNISMIGNAGLLYNITSHFSTLVEVNYRRSLTSVSDATHYSSNPQWIGVGVGIRKKF